MIFSTAQALSILLQYKYWMLFPIAVLEGPIITVIAGLFSSLHYLNFFWAYAIIVVGDLVGDAIHYAMGYWGREKFIERWGRYIGISAEHVERVEEHFMEHSGKTLMLGKLSHGIGGAALVAAGIGKMPFWKFVWYNFLPTVPKSLVLMLIGYYSGSAIENINSDLEMITIVSIALAIVGTLIYVLYRPRKKDPA